jgi:hypothetical protein
LARFLRALLYSLLVKETFEGGLMRTSAAFSVVAVLLSVLALPCCTQPDTPIPRHQTRGLPQGFPADFPLHSGFFVEGSPGKLDWGPGDYFVVKFVTELAPGEIHYFFRKELEADRSYKMLRETGTPDGQGFLVFEKGPRHVEISVGKENGRNTILLRLKDKKSADRQ